MAAETFHSPTPEELMEFVDGEGTPAARAGIEAHLATCPSCQALAAGQRLLSRDAAAWQVAPAPESLRAPQAAVPLLRRPWPLPSRLALAGVSVAALVVVGVSQSRLRPARAPGVEASALQEIGLSDRDVKERRPEQGQGAVRPSFVDPEGPIQGRLDRRAGEENAAQSLVAAPQSGVAHGPAVIRTATLQLVAKDFSTVRSAVERILDGAAGFADQLGVSADPGTARVLRGTLRVPGTQLTDVLTRLRALGLVTQDQQNAQDVADQLVDLDARLKSARATEQRLIELLKNRTGKLSDVLEVEQELTRVRLDIERLDAEKTNMTRRVAYATIDLTIGEERKAGLDSGPLPLLTQIRVAAADGLQNVVDTVVGLALFVLRAGPSLILWGIAAAVAWTIVKRLRLKRAAA
jgi:predicted anti-sigma-YlaC factor YlaD